MDLEPLLAPGKTIKNTNSTCAFGIQTNLKIKAPNSQVHFCWFYGGQLATANILVGRVKMLIGTIPIPSMGLVYLSTYIYRKNAPNVGKHIPNMDGMGLIVHSHLSAVPLSVCWLRPYKIPWKVRCSFEQQHHTSGKTARFNWHKESSVEFSNRTFNPN